MAKFTSFFTPPLPTFNDSNNTTYKFLDQTEDYIMSKAENLALKNVGDIIFPSNPKDGATVSIIDKNMKWRLNNVSINSSSTIDNQSTPFILDDNLPYGVLTFIYDSNNNNWILLIKWPGEQNLIPTADNSNNSTDSNNITTDTSN